MQIKLSRVIYCLLIINYTLEMVHISTLYRSLKTWVGTELENNLLFIS